MILSLLLFLLLLLKYNKLFSITPGLQYSSGALISHLAYVDDRIIFTTTRESCLQKLMDYLYYFEDISGQLINKAKSSIILSKRCSSQIVARVKEITEFSVQQLPITYLGAPLYKERKKEALLDSLISKIRKRITGWEKRCYQ